MAYQVFISYRHMGGEALAYLVNERLSLAGYKVFYDVDSLSSGRFDQKLLKIMDECSDVIVILSPNALDRCKEEEDWLRQEITHALRTGKNVIPLMMEGFRWTDDLPQEILPLQNHQGVSVDFHFFAGVFSRIKQFLHAGNPNFSSRTETEQAIRHILLWGDFDDAVLTKLANKLDLKDYYIEVLSDAVEILSKNLKEIDTIILIVTDVTKLSNYHMALERLNQVLVDYVSSGGRLICTHDVIYRRTRNVKLQEMFGCKIVNFNRIDKVVYKKTETCKEEGCFASLPDSFTLSDGEICWGTLLDDAEVYFVSEEGIPLVFSREYGSGVCLYLNSGDFKEAAPRSIRKPEKEFVALLRECIQFS